MMEQEFPIPIVHVACKRPAALLCWPVRDGDEVDPALVRHLNGFPVRDGDEMVCDTCGESFERLWIAEDGTPRAGSTW